MTTKILKDIMNKLDFSGDNHKKFIRIPKMDDYQLKSTDSEGHYELIYQFKDHIMTISYERDKNLMSASREENRDKVNAFWDNLNNIYSESSIIINKLQGVIDCVSVYGDIDGLASFVKEELIKIQNSL